MLLTPDLLLLHVTKNSLVKLCILHVDALFCAVFIAWNTNFIMKIYPEPTIALLDKLHQMILLKKWVLHHKYFKYLHKTSTTVFHILSAIKHALSGFGVWHHEQKGHKNGTNMDKNHFLLKFLLTRPNWVKMIHSSTVWIFHVNSRFDMTCIVWSLVLRQTPPRLPLMILLAGPNILCFCRILEWNHEIHTCLERPLLERPSLERTFSNL